MPNKLNLMAGIAGLFAFIPGASLAQSINESFYYKLSTEFRGDGMKLDVFNGGPKNNLTRLQPDQDVSGQLWRLVGNGDGTFRLSTLYRGQNMCLDIFNGGPNNNEPHLAPCGNFTGQFWKLKEDGGTIRLTTKFRGPRMCLDIFNGGPNNNQPHLARCGNFTGQLWTFTKTDQRVEDDWSPTVATTPPAPTAPPPGTPPSSQKGESKSSVGSGFFVSKPTGSTDAYVVTNFHVIDGCKSGIKIRYPTYQPVDANVHSVDPANDLSLLSTKLAASGFPSFRLNLKQGEQIASYGFPYGADFASLTMGNVTSVVGLDNNTSAFQISAPIQPGNSGGPLLDMSGRVVGMAQSTLGTLRAAEAFGGAIPQNVNSGITATTIIGGCDQERCSTASRACTMAAISLATSGRLASSKAKFSEVAVICPNPARPRA
jgi:S1-C subfamily serine protease